MQYELSDEELQMVVKGLNHLYAYFMATNRGDSSYKELADRLQRYA